MPNSSRKAKLVIITLTGLLLSPLAISHFDDKQIPQSYRQSWFAMLATNFGPMVAMVRVISPGRRMKWQPTPMNLPLSRRWM